MNADLPIRSRDGFIRPHRSHRTLRVHPAAQLVNFAIFVVSLICTYVVVRFVWPIVTSIAASFAATPPLASAHDLFLGIASTIPAPLLPSLSVQNSLTIAVICALLIIINRFIPRSRHPLRLWIDGNLLVLMIVAFYAFFSGTIAYDGPSFMLLVERTSVLMLLVAPVFCSVVSALLPFSLAEKLSMLLLIVGLDLVFAAVRIAAFALITQSAGAIAEANLYLFFGPLLDVVYFTSVYSLIVVSLASRLARNSETWQWL